MPNQVRHDDNMLPGDRLVCAFVEPQQVGVQFKKWLLHVTIVPWFRSDESSEVIASGIEHALSQIEPFETTVVEQGMFGPRKNRPAMLLEPTKSFEKIEQQVRNYLHKKRAWLVDETTKRPHQFRPHVTVQADKTLNLADSFRCATLYIVEQQGDYKEIVSELRLGRK